MKTLASLACIALVGCGDNNSALDPTPDASTDAAPDAPSAFVLPVPFAVPISTAGPDLLMSAAPGPSGTFFAAGYAAQTVTGTKDVIVVKLSTSGSFDTTFGGGDGIASTGVAFRGGTDEIDIAVQTTGKIVVTATIANAIDANDRDVAVIRLNADGALDNTFGAGGVLTLDLSTAVSDNNMLKGLDAARAVAVGANDAIYVHALQRAEGFITGTTNPRLDTDFALVRLTAAGAPDATFGGGDGKFLLDLQESNANAKGLVILADGSVIGTGYAATPGFGTGVQPVLYKLSTSGELVTSFATGGLFHEGVLAVQMEVYGAAISGDGLVTASYGRNSGSANDWYIMRINSTTGARDTTFGGTTDGLLRIDPSGMNLGSNCRNTIPLPGGRVALFGSTGPSNMPTQDAAFAVLSPNGAFDPEFGGKVHLFQLGANGNDQFWGAAVNGGKTLFVGWKGGGATQTDTVNDDAYGVLLPTP